MCLLCMECYRPYFEESINCGGKASAHKKLQIIRQYIDEYSII